MDFFAYINERIKTMTWVDIGILKVCVFTFTLMLAKLWAPILNPEWYCWGSIFIVTYIYLIYKFYIKILVLRF